MTDLDRSHRRRPRIEAPPFDPDEPCQTGGFTLSGSWSPQETLSSPRGVFAMGCIRNRRTGILGPKAFVEEMLHSDFAQFRRMMEPRSVKLWLGCEEYCEWSCMVVGNSFEESIKRCGGHIEGHWGAGRWFPKTTPIPRWARQLEDAYADRCESEAKASGRKPVAWLVNAIHEAQETP